MIGEQRERLLLSRIDQHDGLRDTRAAKEAPPIASHLKPPGTRRNEASRLVRHGKSLKSVENNAEVVRYAMLSSHGVTRLLKGFTVLCEFRNHSGQREVNPG